MPDDGSGVFTRARDWTTDAAASVPFAPETQDEHDDDMAAAINARARKVDVAADIASAVAAATTALQAYADSASEVDLSAAINAVQIIVSNTNGDGVTLPAATASAAGLLTAASFSKLEALPDPNEILMSVPTRTALKAIDTDDIKFIYLSEAGREQWWHWRVGDFTTQIDTDTQEGKYIKADAVAKNQGAWVAALADQMLNVRKFGAVADGSTSDRDAIQGALDVAALPGEPITIYFPASKSTYLMKGTDAKLVIKSSIVIKGEGMDASRIYRQDYTGNTEAGRKDLAYLDPTAAGANLIFRHIELGGEYEVANYRFPGPQQFEGYLATGAGNTTTSIQLPLSASDVDDYYNGANVQIASGPGQGTDTDITDYDGATRVATLGQTVIGGATPTNLSYVQMGGSAKGFGLDLDDAGTIVFDHIRLRGWRNQAASITNAKRVIAIGCHLYKCARGGLSMRLCNNVTVVGNLCEFVADDAIFNSHTGPEGSVGESVNTLISGNVLIDTVGIRAFGAHKMAITNNVIIRPTIKGIGIGPIDDITQTNMFAVEISGNVIVDPIDRNAIAYNSPSGERAVGIEVFCGSGAEVLRIPGQAYGGVISLPEDNILSGNIRIPGMDITLKDNLITSLMKVGNDFSDYNGFGVFYHRGSMITTNPGFIDRTIALSDISYYPIKIVGPVHGITIEGNDLMGRGDYPGVSFQGNDTSGGSGLTANIHADYTITAARVWKNKIRRVSSALHIENDGATDKLAQLDFAFNEVDGDPYFENALRKTGPIDGTWTANTQWVVDNLRTDGVSFRHNTIRNFAAIRRRAFATEQGNTIYAKIAASDFSTSNGGVGTLPTSPGYAIVDTDCNPLSATYMASSLPILSATAQPTSGRQMAGHFVRNVAPVVGSDGSYVVGWQKRATGGGHVPLTDWYEVRAFGQGSSWEGTIDFANIIFSGGTAPTASPGNDKLDYFGHRIGNLVFLDVRLLFANAGAATYTDLECLLSHLGAPAPKQFAGMASGAVQTMSSVTAVLTLTSASGARAATRGDIYKTAGDAFRIRAQSGGGAYAVCSFKAWYIAA